MADPKKPEGKPAGKPEASSVGAFDADLAKFRMAVIVLAILTVVITGLTMRFGLTADGAIRFPPVGDIDRGSRVANITDVEVRSAPGGSLIGTQDRREFGTVREGPVEFGEQRWWRIAYDEAPSGWVEEEDLTTVLWLFILLNIIPYSFGYVMPVAIVVFIVSGIGLLVVRHKISLVPLVNQREEEEWLRRHNRSIGRIDASSEAIAAQAFKADPRWEHIERMADSTNPNDWRQAIIEADIILEDILSKIGYDGLTIGDKLKNVEPSDMLTLDDAWTAHKVRNRIAHEGMNYRLTHNDVKETVGRYRRVFEEFNLV